MLIPDLIIQLITVVIGVALYAAIIVKHVDAKTLGKVGCNELLRSIEEENMKA